MGPVPRIAYPDKEIVRLVYMKGPTVDKRMQRLLHPFSLLRRVRDSNPRNTQMLVTVSFPALYSGLINQFLRIFKPALPDFYQFFFTWKNYAKVQKNLEL